METLKRIINLTYALSLIGFGLFIAPLANARGIISILIISALVVAVINFSLFKKLTLWNK